MCKNMINSIVIFLYLTGIGTALAVFHFMSIDEKLLSCDTFKNTKNTCLSNNLDLDIEANSTVQTVVAQCIIGERKTEKCVKPKTFVFYDLLSMPRMTYRLGYSSQCALEGF